MKERARVRMEETKTAESQEGPKERGREKEEREGKEGKKGGIKGKKEKE